MERVEKGHRTALDLALEAFAEVRAEQAAKQGDLFADGVDNLPEVVAPLAADGLGAADGQALAAVAQTNWRAGISSAMTGATHWSAALRFPVCRYWPAVYWRHWPSGWTVPAMRPPSSGPQSSRRRFRSYINAKRRLRCVPVARLVLVNQSCGK